MNAIRFLLLDLSVATLDVVTHPAHNDPGFAVRTPVAASREVDQSSVVTRTPAGIMALVPRAFGLIVRMFMAVATHNLPAADARDHNLIE